MGQMGGQQAVIGFSRNTKANQIMIIEEKAKAYRTEVNFGGKLIKICIPENEDSHDWILEITAQMLSSKELVKEAERKIKERGKRREKKKERSRKNTKKRKNTK